ncbi:MAG: DUF3570 domain-containing protein [Ginsengibacter sp.]
MKRIFLTAVGLALLLTSLKAQTPASDSSGYKSRQLKLDEINFVSSYYSQNGNNSAVTGGIGTEKLNDFANVIDLNLMRYDKHSRKHTLGLEAGIDHYTSASSDLIDLKANSSASHADTRIYPSVNYTVENEAKGLTIGGGLAYSTEFDYQSYGANVIVASKTKNRSGELTFKFQTYLDKVSIIKPVELRTQQRGDNENYPTSARNTFAGSLSYSQIINEKLQVMFLADLITQQGYLSLPFHRVYFNDASVHQESLPESRLKIPLGFRASYFVGDKVIVRAYYRFYQDDWGLTAHTANLEIPVKLTPFLSISPFYRFYDQTAARYFKPYKIHISGDQYYTSNYDLSSFSSNFYGAGIRIAPPKGIFGFQHFSMLELRYGHYTKNVGMNSDIISLNLKFK